MGVPLSAHSPTAFLFTMQNAAMKHSVYQKLIFDFVRYSEANAVVEAVAGSGKTTTAVQSMKHVPAYMDILFAAFNKSIVEELEKRVPDGVTVKTMHSLGWSAMKRHYGGDIQLVERKSFSHAEKLFYKMRREKWYWGYLHNLIKLADIVRQNVEFDETTIEEAMEKHGVSILTGEEPLHVMQLIKSMCSDLDVFDFTDMIFFPAINPSIRLPKFDFVFIDELQDLNRAQQVMIESMLNKKSRFIGVGDSRQAIYGFRGSDEQSFTRFRNMPNTSGLPLSICYRCGKAIVEEAKLIVPQIQWYPFQEDGKVRTGQIDEITGGDWVICRNTKPLVILAFMLISDGKKAKIKGKEIGENIISLLQSTGVNLQSVALRILKSKRDQLLLQYRDHYKMEKPELHPKVISLEENIGVIEFLFDKMGGDVRRVIKFLQETFSDDHADIMLSTIHKAKGLENDRVFFLRPDLIPSRYAINTWQKEQEENLRYVAITRAKKELVYVHDFPYEQLSKMILNNERY